MATPENPNAHEDVVLRESSVPATTPRVLSFHDWVNAAVELLIGAAIGMIFTSILAVSRHDGTPWHVVGIYQTPIVIFFILMVIALLWLSKEPLSRLGGTLVPTSRRFHLAASLSVGLFGALISGIISTFFISFSPISTSASVDQRQLIPVYPAAATPPLIAYVIFFDNGSAKLRTEQESALRTFLNPLHRCIGSKVFAVGFASSAKFVSNDEEQNLRLAHDRVNAVRVIGAEESVNITDKRPWPNLGALAASRLMVDTDGQKRIPEREPFNRRVEITVEDLGECALR